MTEALLVAQRLAEIYADRLYVALNFHGSPSDKVINRGLLAVAQRLELVPLGGRGTQLSALAVAIEQRRDDVPLPWSLLA